MSPILHGFAVALSPANLGWALAGATLGTAVGVLPGIGPALTVALLLPVTYSLDPTAALIMFAGIYYGAMYGGSTTSILLNTPGESATVVTALEGHEMAKRGRGGAALSTAAIGSFVAGTLATFGLSVAAPALVRLALVFGPAEYFALTVMAFVLICRSVGPSLARGLLSLFIGLALGLVGIDALSGQARLTFGIPYLLDGVDVVIVAVGLFAVGEALTGLAQGDVDSDVLPDRIARVDDSVTTGRDRGSRGCAARRSDFPLGALPAGRRRTADAALVRDREAPDEAPGGIRTRRNRGRRWPRGRQQRRGRRHARPAADARPADVRDRGRAARRLPAVRPAAGTAPVRTRAGSRVGRHREPLRRERDAARAQPAARDALGQAARDSEAAALRGDSRDRDPRARTASTTRSAISCC